MWITSLHMLPWNGRIGFQSSEHTFGHLSQKMQDSGLFVYRGSIMQCIDIDIIMYIYIYSPYLAKYWYSPNKLNTDIVPT